MLYVGLAVSFREIYLIVVSKEKALTGLPKLGTYLGVPLQADIGQQMHDIIMLQCPERTAIEFEKKNNRGNETVAVALSYLATFSLFYKLDRKAMLYMSGFANKFKISMGIITTRGSSGNRNHFDNMHLLAKLAITGQGSDDFFVYYLQAVLVPFEHGGNKLLPRLCITEMQKL